MLGSRKAERTPTPTAVPSLSDPAELAKVMATVARDACLDTQAIKRSLPDVAVEVMALCQQSFSDALRIEKAIYAIPS